MTGAPNRTRFIQAVSTAAFLGLWEVLGRTGAIPGGVLPPFSTVADRLVRLLGSPLIWFDLQVSGYEIGVGFLIGSAAGLLFAVLLSTRSVLRRASEPLLYYLSALPKIIVLPVLLLFLGSGIFSKVGIAAVSAFFPVGIATMLAVREVKPIHLTTARLLGASRWRLYTAVYLPSAVAPILAGLRLGLGVAITGALLAETSVASAGLGYRAIEFYSNLHLADMYALLLLVFLIAVAVNAGFSALTRYFTRHEQSPEQRWFTG